MKFDLNSALQILERTPSVLEQLVSNLDDLWIYSNEGPETFSPFDVVGHLIHGEKTDWIPRLEIILTKGTDRPFDVYDRFAQNRESRGKTIQQLLREFRQLREDNLQKVRSLELDSQHLALRGLHQALGEVTLEQLLAAWVVHDLGHIAQISRVMAKQLTEAVGPWTEYMAVLSDRPTPNS